MENYVDESGFAPLNLTKFTRDEEHMKEEDFPFEVVDQSKPTSFLQDFHHLDHDHQFDHHYHHHHGSTSSNPSLLGAPRTLSCINKVPLQHCSYQENLVDFYESKPHLMNHHFQASDNQYFTRDHHHQEISLVDEHNPVDLEQNNMMMMRMLPFEYSPTAIIKPTNFMMPDEVSCVSADNNCYKAMSFNKTKPFLTRNLSSSSSSSSWKGKNNTTLVKGQWTAEEDRFVINNIKLTIILHNQYF